ncbi:MAG: hypothetical protein C0483_09935 [Pirellula sp.]|nr:hypothetical protein [Pirellula sp.]
MRIARSRRLPVGALGALLVPMLLVMRASVDAEEPSPPSRYALLVGCTEYSELGPDYRLQGPDNDVGLIHRMLRERFQFQDTDIVHLVAAQPPMLRPTRINILRELERLTERIRDGDQVVLLLAGHGSQLPDYDGDEDDGFDEVFLPEDTPRSANAGNVERGITDDALASFFGQWRQKGANVLFLADTCHSGTMSRGWDNADRTRGVRHVPADVLSSPDLVRDAERKAREQLANSATAKKEHDETRQDDLRGGLTALFAVPPTALEQEHPMPPPNCAADAARFGRLTYALHQVLATAQTPLTHRELGQALARQYRDWAWFPLPEMETTYLDKEVLGKRTWNDRSALQFSRASDGTLELNQGLVHGLSPGTIVRILPDSSHIVDPNAVQAQRYVTVARATPLNAVVEPIAFDGASAVSPADVRTPASCEIAQLDYGPLKLSVRAIALHEHDPNAPKVDASQVQRLRTTVSELATAKEALVREAGPNELADVLLIAGPRGIAMRLRDEERSPLTANEVRTDLFGPYSVDDTLSVALARDLRQIAVAENLRRLAVDGRPQNVSKRDKASVHVDWRLARGHTTKGPWTPLSDGDERRFTRGDVLRLTLQNVGTTPADVTVLYLDAARQIQSQYPSLRASQAGAYNTLSPGAIHELTIKINDGTVGAEDILIVSVLHTPPLSVNFAFLQQPGLTPADLRQVRGESTSPLDALLEASLSGTRGTRRTNMARPFTLQRIRLDVFRSP